MAWKERWIQGLEEGNQGTDLSIDRTEMFLWYRFHHKECFRALNHRLGYRFYHLIKIKTHLNTTLIGRIGDKQIENLK